MIVWQEKSDLHQVTKSVLAVLEENKSNSFFQRRTRIHQFPSNEKSRGEQLIFVSVRVTLDDGTECSSSRNTNLKITSEIQKRADS